MPGGPTRRTPLGILPPMSVYFFGFLRKSTTSTSSSLASSTPATSPKRVLTSPSATIIALFWPKARTPPPGLPMRLKRKRQMTNMNTRGSTVVSSRLRMVLSRFSTA